MALGEVRVLSDAQSIRAFEIVGAGTAREYQVIVMSASQVPGSATPISFSARASGAGASVAPSTTVLPAQSLRAGVGSRGPNDLNEVQRALLRPRHLEFRAQMEAEARRVNARVSPKAPSRGGSRPAQPGFAANVTRSSGIPIVGETLTILSAITPGGGLTCNGSTPVDGIVKSVGQNFVIVEDPAVSGHFSAQDYAELDTELDAFVAPIDNEYFGSPADLDGNERVIVFFTGQVNRLSSQGSSSIIIGFFTSLDLLDPVDCPSSNEAEVVWLIGPDPDGTIGASISAQFVKSIARGLVAHEYQHLLNAEQRFILGNGQFNEDIWMNEGMSHIAEEAAGLYRIGSQTRGELGFNEIGVGTVERPAFDDFHFGNFRNLDDYLTAPTQVDALSVGNPDNSFPMRGWGYMFLRWLADRYAPASPVGLLAGSGEYALFRELARGGATHSVGIQNVLSAIATVSGESPTWDEVLEQYFVAPVTDEVSSVPAELQFSTWNFPRLYSEMASNSVPGLSGGFPLRPTPVSMGSGASSSSNFDVGASTARYFRFTSSGAHPDMVVQLSSPSGANVPNGARARVIVVRTR
jgi:hypothetical protein